MISASKLAAGASRQGTENNLSDFPDAVTVAGAIEKTIGKHNVMTLSSSQLDLKERPDVAIVAMGEDSYAEWLGDIPDNKTLSYSELKAGYSGDLKLLKNLIKPVSRRLLFCFLADRSTSTKRSIFPMHSLPHGYRAPKQKALPMSSSATLAVR